MIRCPSPPFIAHLQHPEIGILNNQSDVIYSDSSDIKAISDRVSIIHPIMLLSCDSFFLL